MEDEDEQEAVRPKLKEWGREKREINVRLAALNKRLDEERGDGPGEGLMTIKRLRAQALTLDGPDACRPAGKSMPLSPA